MHTEQQQQQHQRQHLSTLYMHTRLLCLRGASPNCRSNLSRALAFRLTDAGMPSSIAGPTTAHSPLHCMHATQLRVLVCVQPACDATCEMACRHLVGCVVGRVLGPPHGRGLLATVPGNGPNGPWCKPSAGLPYIRTPPPLQQELEVENKRLTAALQKKELKLRDGGCMGRLALQQARREC